jgi:hypothetical protein
LRTGHREPAEGSLEAGRVADSSFAGPVQNQTLGIAVQVLLALASGKANEQAPGWNSAKNHDHTEAK